MSIPEDKLFQYIDANKTVLYNISFHNNLNDLQYFLKDNTHTILIKYMIENSEYIDLLIELIRSNKYDCFVFLYHIGLKNSLLENSSKKLIDDLLYEAIINESLSYIIYLVENGCKIPEYTCRFAAENNNYELLKIGFKKGAPLFGKNILTPYELALSNDMDPVIYPSTFNICTIALKTKIKIFEFGHLNGCKIEGHVKPYLNNL
jgi:hypothetical protein